MRPRSFWLIQVSDLYQKLGQEKSFSKANCRTKKTTDLPLVAQMLAKFKIPRRGENSGTNSQAVAKRVARLHLVWRPKRLQTRCLAFWSGGVPGGRNRNPQEALLVYFAMHHHKARNETVGVNQRIQDLLAWAGKGISRAGARKGPFYILL